MKNLAVIINETQFTANTLNQLDEIAIAVITDKMDKIMKEKWFSICTIDQCLELAEMRSQCARSYRILHMYHCVEWDKIPDAVVNNIPTLVRRIFGVEQ